MKRQNVRKLLLLVSLLLFPITLYYFSPALPFSAAMEGVLNGSLIVFALLFLLSIPFGRLFCAWLCPGGGIQECAFAVNGRAPKQGWRNYMKYIIWAIWLGAVVFFYAQGGGFRTVDFFFDTDHGVSVSNLPAYIIYYGIVFLLLIPGILGGKRAFCHYFCWMAPFMVLGTKLRRALRLPGLRLAARREDCVSCGACTRACPMGLDVKEMVQRTGKCVNIECIQCGACIDACGKAALHYTMRPESGGADNGGGKKAGLSHTGAIKP